MKYLDEYRDGDAAQKFAQEIHRITTRSWNIMEICGGQTHAFLHHGLDDMLISHSIVCRLVLEVLEMGHLIQSAYDMACIDLTRYGFS